MKHYDFCVVGAGIVGLATAQALLRSCPTARILVIEKEQEPARHQTGHNSGVIHAGIYYAPGSLKAELCRQGLDETKSFCRDYNIPFEECGKLIVATDPVEEERIEALFDRALANDLTLDKLSNRELRLREPNINGVSALLSPETAIVDFTVVAKKLADILKDKGVDINYKDEVLSIDESGSQVAVKTRNHEFCSNQLVVCGGLQSDRLAKIAGLPIDFRIIPFRGEYYQLPKSKHRIVNHLIYPAPDPNLPFLGVHLTRMIDGSITLGPNAVLGFARESYPKWSFDLKDALDIFSFSGFWKLVNNHKSHTLHELHTSLSRRAYLKECQKYCPSLELNDLKPYRSGIRAQAVSLNGELIHDFMFKQTKRMLHVCNAPSPAATSSLPIGRMIAHKVLNCLPS